MLFLHEPKQVLVLVELSVQLALCQYNIASGITDGGRGANCPPGKLNVKVVSHLTYILVLAFFWFSVGCCFCVFFGLFSGDSRF